MLRIKLVSALAIIAAATIASASAIAGTVHSDPNLAGSNHTAAVESDHDQFAKVQFQDFHIT